VLYAAAVALIVALAAALRAPSLYEPRWYRDEGIFAAVAQNLRDGQTLYSDAWDNKPPLIFYTYAAIQSLFGTGVFPLHAVASVAVLATLVIVIALALNVYGRGPSLTAGVVFAAAMCTPVIEGPLALTETFMILPVSLAMLVFVASADRDDSVQVSAFVASGVLLGIAAAYKQVAAFDALALIVMLWLTHGHPLRASALVVAGAAIPHLAFVAYFAATGALSEYWYAVAGSLPLYNDLGPESGPLLRIIAYCPALLIVAWLVRLRTSGETIDARYLPPVWLAFSVIGATSSTLEFPHYLQQAAPAFALTIAGLPALAQERRDALLPACAGVLAALVCTAQFGEPIVERRQLQPVAYYENYISYESGDRDQQQYERFFDGSVESVRDISRAIHEDGAGTTLYTWSELPWVYAEGGFQNPSRYYTSFLGELIPGAKEEILADLQRDPPAYIVLTSTTYAPFGELEDWMKGRYQEIASAGDWRLYRHGP
jgi:4-amino-4-deoxy-L-arabinose transferase-like glycosyltransferase